MSVSVVKKIYGELTELDVTCIKRAYDNLCEAEHNAQDAHSFLSSIAKDEGEKVPKRKARSDSALFNEAAEKLHDMVAFHAPEADKTKTARGLLKLCVEGPSNAD